MQRIQRALNAGPYELANDVFNSILVKSIQNVIQSPTGKSFYKGNQWKVTAKYNTKESFMKESYNEVLDLFAALIKDNLGANDLNKLDKPLKTKIINMLANDLLAILKNGEYINDGGAMYDDEKHIEKLYYYFDINVRNREEFKQQMTTQLQNTFRSIKEMLPKSSMSNTLPATPVIDQRALPVTPAVENIQPAPAAVGLKR